MTALVVPKAKVKAMEMRTLKVTALELVMCLGMVKASGTVLELVWVQVKASVKVMETETAKARVLEKSLLRRVS